MLNKYKINMMIRLHTKISEIKRVMSLITNVYHRDGELLRKHYDTFYVEIKHMNFEGRERRVIDD
jgi:hypothetical protein